MFCYSDAPSGPKTPVDIWKMNATKVYMTHFANFLYLDFMLNSGTYAEQHQARKELVICERKMTFWQRHPNFDRAAVDQQKEKMLADWKTGGRSAIAPAIETTITRTVKQPRFTPKPSKFQPLKKTYPVDYEPDF